jgi:hypothetical protein
LAIFIAFSTFSNAKSHFRPDFGTPNPPNLRVFRPFPSSRRFFQSFFDHFLTIFNPFLAILSLFRPFLTQNRPPDLILALLTPQTCAFSGPRGETPASLHAAGADTPGEAARVRAWEDGLAREAMAQRRRGEELRRRAVMSRRWVVGGAGHWCGWVRMVVGSSLVPDSSGLVRYWASFDLFDLFDFLIFLIFWFFWFFFIFRCVRLAEWLFGVGDVGEWCGWVRLVVGSSLVPDSLGLVGYWASFDVFWFLIFFDFFDFLIFFFFDVCA